MSTGGWLTKDMNTSKMTFKPRATGGYYTIDPVTGGTVVVEDVSGFHASVRGHSAGDYKWKARGITSASNGLVGFGRTREDAVRNMKTQA